MHGATSASCEAWLRSHLVHDVRATAAAVGAVPVLIAQGAVDQQVTVADADALADALTASRARVTTRIYPTLNHNFVTSATGDVSEYVDPDARIDAQLVSDVVQFVAGVR